MADSDDVEQLLHLLLNAIQRGEEGGGEPLEFLYDLVLVDAEEDAAEYNAHKIVSMKKLVKALNSCISSTRAHLLAQDAEAAFQLEKRRGRYSPDDYDDE